MDILDEPEIPQEESHWLDPWSFIPVAVIIASWRGGAFLAPLLGLNPCSYIWYIRAYNTSSVAGTTLILLASACAFVLKEPSWIKTISLDALMLVAYFNIDVALPEVVNDGVFAYYTLKIGYTIITNIRSL